MIIFYLPVSQIKAKFKGKLTKNGYLEMPVVIASSDDETVIQAQKNAQTKPASLRPLRRKGTFFCVTGQNTVFYNQENSSVDFSDQEEVDDFIASLLSRTKQNGYNSNKSLPRKENHSSGIASRQEPERKFVNNNGHFKLISVVWNFNRENCGRIINYTSHLDLDLTSFLGFLSPKILRWWMIKGEEEPFIPYYILQCFIPLAQYA